MSTDDHAPHKEGGKRPGAVSTDSHYDLTKFQLRVLGTLAEEARYGLAIKRELEDYYGKEVHHGRLYPNLDDLVEKGLVAKRELDKRTNEYRLTQDGAAHVLREAQWMLDRLDVRVSKDDAFEDGLYRSVTTDEIGLWTPAETEGDE